MTDKLPDWVKPGASFHVTALGKQTLVHVRGIIDGHAVVKSWSRTKGWVYAVLEPEYFEIYGREPSLIQPVRKPNDK